MRGVSARGVLVLVTRRSYAVLWRACSRVRASFGISLEFLFVGIFEFMWGQVHVVQGFPYIVRLKACKCAFQCFVSGAFARGMLAP